MRILGIVPARRGSKGLPDKNVRKLLGQSLVERAVHCGLSANIMDRLIINTDSKRIARLAESAGAEVPFLRPAHLAEDSTPMIDVVTHALGMLRSEGYEPDAVMLLQPTSPLRKPQHLQEAVSRLGAADSVCSVVALPKDQCPHYLMRIADGYLTHFLPDGAVYARRQDVPQAYRRDGTVYLTRTAVITEGNSLYGQSCVPMVIPQEESITIDTKEDWAEARRRLRTSLRMQ